VQHKEALMLTRAIVRPPGHNFAEGLTTVDLGIPDYQLALVQHEQYCQALQQCGLSLTRLEADERFPDSTFVEDVAILTPRGCIFTAPGAASRAGEVAAIRDTVLSVFTSPFRIESPGTLEGGDICRVGEHFFIGISKRTNDEGARQLAHILSQLGYTSSFIDMRDIHTILHLKTGMTSLGDGRLAVIEALAVHPVLRAYELVRTVSGEEYAANCIRINDHVLVAAGFPAFEKLVRDLGYHVIPVAMSEFSKQDGGLSCLSLRF
jgi:dimethylargininase